MDSYSLHKIAMDYAENVWQERGDYVSTYYATITVLISDGGHIYTGITGLTVNYGDIEILRSEKGAISAMLLDGQTYAKQMVTLSFKTRKVSDPNEESLKLLYELDHRNANCEILTSPEESTTIGEVIGVEYDPAEEEANAAAEAAVQAEEAPAVAEEPAPEPVEESAPVEEVAEESSAEETPEEETVDEEEDVSESSDEADETEESEEAPIEEEPAEESEEAEETDEDESDSDEETDDDEEEIEESAETSEDNGETLKLDDGEQPDFMMGFDFGDDTGPTSEIVVPKVQKSYEKYDKKTTAKRTEKDFSDGVKIDTDNPFFDAGASEQKEVVAFADKDSAKTPAHEESAPQQPTMSKKEMLKMAKKRKKIAKNNNRYR